MGTTESTVRWAEIRRAGLEGTRRGKRVVEYVTPAEKRRQQKSNPCV